MRLLLFSVLLTIVYSWEEIKLVLLKSWRRWEGKRSFYDYGDGSDKFVGLSLMYMAIPLTLIHYLGSEKEPLLKLTILSAELLAIALFSAGLRILSNRTRIIGKYQGMEKVGAVGFALAGMVSPTFLMFRRHAVTEHDLVGRFALFLSLPALAGLALAYVSPKDIITGDILPNINVLNAVMVGGLFINISVRFLEKHFRLNSFDIMSYGRIALGVFILAVISEGLIG
jgi:hypothetical protein